MVEYFLHDVLGDIAVYEPGAERVPPLMRSQVQGAAVLIAARSGPDRTIRPLVSRLKEDDSS